MQIAHFQPILLLILCLAGWVLPGMGQVESDDSRQKATSTKVDNPSSPWTMELGLGLPYIIGTEGWKDADAFRRLNLGIALDIRLQYRAPNFNRLGWFVGYQYGYWGNTQRRSEATNDRVQYDLKQWQLFAGAKYFLSDRIYVEAGLGTATHVVEDSFMINGATRSYDFGNSPVVRLAAGYQLRRNNWSDPVEISFITQGTTRSLGGRGRLRFMGVRIAAVISNYASDAYTKRKKERKTSAPQLPITATPEPDEPTPDSAETVKVPTLVLEVRDRRDRSLLPATLEWHPVEALSGRQTLATRDGEARFEVEPGMTYRFQVRSEGAGQAYLPLDTVFSIPAELTGERKQQVYLTPATVGETFTTRAINFGYDSDELTEESFEVLDLVVKVMQSAPALKLEVAAHTDERGSASYNRSLSERRAASVVSYLTSHGVATNRLQAVGYGETELLCEENTDDCHARNRRVEMKVVE